HRSMSVLRWSETVLDVLAEAGLEGVARVVALRGLLSYVIGAVQLEHLGPLSGAGTVALSELPEPVFPRMAETARTALSVGADEEFRRGLGLVLDGIAASLGRPGGRRRSAGRAAAPCGSGGAGARPTPAGARAGAG